MRKVVIEITSDHINESIWSDVTNNPISLAIKNYFGHTCCLRTRTLGLIKHGSVIPLPDHIEALFEMHNDGVLQETSFELEVPEDWF